jgi:hypothetical protein
MTVTRYRFERDRGKDNALHRADIEVMRIVRRDILERSHALIADITRALARRGGAIAPSGSVQRVQVGGEVAVHEGVDGEAGNAAAEVDLA